MFMLDFIYSIPSYALRIVLTIITAGFLFGCTMIIKRYCPIGNTDTSTALGVSQTVAMIYAMFVGFIIFASMASYSSAQSSEVNEANIINSISYESSILPKPMSVKIHNVLVKYLKATVNEEWPDAREGKINTSASVPIEELMQLLAKYKPVNGVELNIWTDLVDKVNELRTEYSVRHEASSRSGIGKSIWACIIIATLVMLISNTFFTYESRRLQCLLLIILSSVTSSLIFLEINMDFPYRGFYAVPSDHLQYTLQVMQDKVFSI